MWRAELHYEDDGTPVLKKAGVEMSRDDARELIGALDRRYPPKAWVYIGVHEQFGLHKIGMTTRPQLRASELGIDILHMIECDDPEVARILEDMIHFTLRRHCAYGEWYRFKRGEHEFLLQHTIALSAYAACAVRMADSLPEDLQADLVQKLRDIADDLEGKTE